MKVAEVELCQEANEAMGEWLSGFPWEWYTTHTFKKMDTGSKKADLAWYAWLNSLYLTLGKHHPVYVRTTEYQQRGTIHYHALLANLGATSRNLFKDLWGISGFGKVMKYDPNRGAGFYLGKYLTKDVGEIRFSHNFKHLQSIA